MKAGRILVVEQDEAIALEVAAALEKAGYTVIKTKNTREGIRKLYQEYPDLVILARDLPMLHGEEACLRVRQACYLPIIVLGDDNDASEILDIGADAYLMKPPGLTELVARVNSLLRRKRMYKLHTSSIKPQLEDDQSMEWDGAKLTTTEIRLASCLLRNKGELLEYSQIIRDVWRGNGVSLCTLHFYIRSLRKKLQIVFPNLFNINSYRGVGYRLEKMEK